jgi:hypothetical protein
MIRHHGTGTVFTFPNGYEVSIALPYDRSVNVSGEGLECDVVHVLWTAYGGAFQDAGMLDPVELVAMLGKIAAIPTFKANFMGRFKEGPPRYEHNRIGAIYLGRYDRVHLVAISDDLWYQDGEVYARCGPSHHDISSSEQEPNHPSIRCALSRARSLGLPVKTPATTL